jgi:hypothetical protein
VTKITELPDFARSADAPPPAPKPGEWWIVEFDACYPKHVTRKEREVALRTDAGWSMAGSAEDASDVFFTPVRRVDIWGASLGESAQSGRKT